MADVANFWRRFMHRHAPTRDEVLESRWLQPFGERIRHSRPVALHPPLGAARVFAGLFVGIFLMVPGLQIVGAALMCDPVARQYPDRRGDDLPVSNPATTPFFLLASLEVGSWLGFHADLATFEALAHAPCRRSANGSPGCGPTPRRRWCRACS